MDSDDNSHSTETASMGYRRPPEATRFKPGVSGNPKGRPKGSLNVATAFMKALREKVVINEHGQRKKVTKLEAALKQLVNKAASGDLRALTQLVQLAQDAESKQALASPHSPALNQLGQQVMADILNRFQVAENESEPPKEAEHGDTTERA